MKRLFVFLFVSLLTFSGCGAQASGRDVPVSGGKVGKFVEVPDLVGLTADAGLARAMGAGLDLRVVNVDQGRIVGRISKWKITHQSPAAGEELAKGGLIDARVVEVTSPEEP